MAKKTRKELLKQDDAFISTAGQGIDWVREHSVLVVAAVATVALMVLGVILGSSYVASRRLEGSESVFTALKVLDAQVLAEGSAEEADPTAEPPTFATEADRAEAARAAFDAAVARGPDDGAGLFARFYSAHLAAEQGDSAEALALYQRLISDLGPDDSLFFLAAERAAYLQEASGEIDAALRTLAPLADNKEAFYGDRAALLQGRLLSKQGQVDRARESLQRIRQDFPASGILPEVEKVLADLPASAGKGEAGDPQPAPQTRSSAAAAPASENLARANDEGLAPGAAGKAAP